MKYYKIIDKLMAEQAVKEAKKSYKNEIDINPRDWQKKLIEELEGEPSSEKILIYIDEEGGMGKSVLATWLVINKGAILLRGKCDDIFYAYNGERIAIFDIPRNGAEHINWQAVETIKNGVFMSSKYEAKMKMFKKPHVIVFTNEIPRTGVLSEYKKDIRELKGILRY